ncbi:hypothetical protein J6590_007046 [Homalodisca vitripennis]|nr:hypothetical protein J6590_007046 [Homalodisca vitripennis]
MKVQRSLMLHTVVTCKPLQHVVSSRQRIRYRRDPDPPSPPDPVASKGGTRPTWRSSVLLEAIDRRSNVLLL